ncbi:GNAT family N-acetyltransferase [Candidatus Alkanophaga liquidiphilum]|nr:Ribosomal protein S18 acetylase RimI [Candidatus Alkanophaga liquidiphilum]
MVLVRKARDADLPEVVRVWKMNIKTANTASDIAFLFRRFKRYFFVAEAGEDGRIVGFVGGSVRSGHGHISGIAVDREFRNRGVGSLLIGAAEQEFRREGFDRVTLEVRVSNENAIRFYEKRGYRRLYTINGYYADGENAYFYEKLLEK